MIISQVYYSFMNVFSPRINSLQNYVSIFSIYMYVRKLETHAVKIDAENVEKLTL